MKIPDFYESRWNNAGVVGIKCKGNGDDPDYLRKEYELWALWIDKFYEGIFKIGGDAPRYVLEDHMDFCFWEKIYKKNYKKKDHLSNHRARSLYIIYLLTELFEEVNNYVPRDDDYDYEEQRYKFDPLSLTEMKEKMSDPTYKQKWFQAAYDANNYISRKLTTKSRKQSKKLSKRKSKKIRK
jgi:hypothetical protein